MIDAPPKFAAVRNLPSAYDLFVAIAAVISIGGITWNMLLPDTSEVSKLLEIFDWAFCALFLGDYIRQIVLSKNKLKYIFTWGIFDLVYAFQLALAKYVFKVFIAAFDTPFIYWARTWDVPEPVAERPSQRLAEGRS